jgi:hypothetical protein
MIIHSHQNIEGTSAVYDGDKVRAVHAESVDEVLRANQLDRLTEGNGWTKQRDFRHIARITPLTYLNIQEKYPDILSSDRVIRDRAWKKALVDPEFALCATVRKGL